MKRVICYASMIAIAMVTLVSGCIDQNKDFYDETRRTPNPMGDDFVAPDDFDWSAITTSKITVNVNDEFNGQYFYVIEIYNANPILFPQTAHLLGKGVAKINAPYSSEIACQKGTENIYIKQIDPRGRAIVKTVPFNSTINSSFSSDASTVKTAAMTKSSMATRSDFEMPKYDKIPDGATEVKGSSHADWFKAGMNYKITGNYKDGIYHSGTSTTCKLFISGTWTVPANAENWTSVFNQGIEVIVMPGGKIICNNSKLEFNGKSKLIIMPNGVLDCQALYATNTAEYYNSGTISVKDYIKMDANSQIFNNCSITVQNILNCDGAIINMNQGSIITTKFKFNNATINLNNGSMLKAEEIQNISNNNYSNSKANRSLIKALTIGYGWGGSNYKGNITIETDHIKKIEGNSFVDFSEWEHQMSSFYKTDSKTNETGYDQSNVVIASCSGIENGGNEGHEPGNPEFPIIMEDNKNYAYLFEDQWPSYGDYDLNDIVIQLSKRKIKEDKNGKVKEVELEFNLCAVGALNNIAAALMLDKVPASAITSKVDIEDFDDPQSFFNLTNKNIEAKQSNAVIPLFWNAHYLMGQPINVFVNTISDSPNNVKKYPTIEISIEFDNPTLSPDAFNVNNLNLFIITDRSNKRKEIHMAGYKPSALADTSMFGSNDDASTNGKYYISKENLAWGFMVPQQFKWTLEKHNIKNVYSKFKTWVTSGGKEELNWWNSFDEKRTFQNNKN